MNREKLNFYEFEENKNNKSVKKIQKKIGFFFKQNI